MKEVTIVTLVETTDVFPLNDNEILTSDEECAIRIKAILNADDVKIKKRQIFIRDLPNTSEVVVGTPETAVQGG